MLSTFLTSNATTTAHLSAVLGTWTATADTYRPPHALYTPHIAAHVVTHLIPEPTRRYREECECDEVSQNQVCWGNSCQDIADSVLWWSDAAAFTTWGVDITYYPSRNDSVVVPAPQVLQRDTGGWLGPYSMLLPESTNHHYRNNDSSPTSSQYSIVTRYVQTWTTSLLQPLPQATVYNDETADQIMGATAVKATIAAQTVPTDVLVVRDTVDACGDDNVLVKPTLPLYNFTGTDRSRMQFTIWLMVKPDDPLYTILPLMYEEMKSWGQSGDLELRGPFCSQSDPQGA
jgi:hypothetical protein